MELDMQLQVVVDSTNMRCKCIVWLVCCNAELSFCTELTQTAWVYAVLQVAAARHVLEALVWSAVTVAPYCAYMLFGYNQFCKGVYQG